MNLFSKYGGLISWAYLAALVQKDSRDLGSHAPWVIVPVHQVVNTGVGSRATGVDLQQADTGRQDTWNNTQV